MGVISHPSSRLFVGSLGRVAAWALALAGCGWPSLAATAAEPAWTLERMLTVASISHVVPSPDGERVAYVASRVDSAGRSVAHLYVASADGAAIRRFTFDRSRVEAPAWSPDGRWLAYLRTTDERTGELVSLRADGGAPQPLSDAGAPVEAFQWSPDGDGIAFLRTEAAGGEPASGGTARARVVGGHGGRRQLWWLDLDAQGNPGRPRRLTPTGYHVGNNDPSGAFDLSPDGRYIAFTHTRSPAADDWKTADISVLETATGKVRPFQQSDAAEFAPRYSPDGRHIAFNISVFPPSAIAQWRVGLARRDGSGLKLLAATPDEQPRLVGWITDRLLLVQEPDRTTTALWRLPTDGGSPRRFDDGGSVLSAVTLNESATRLGFATMDQRKPPEAAVTALRRFRPVTVSAVNALHAGRAVPTTRVVSWHSGGDEVEGLLTLPGDQRGGPPHPLLVLIHADPAGTFSRDYPGALTDVPALAALAERGYAVLRVNLHGASGYGHRFRASAADAWNGAGYDDLMGGVDHVIAEGLADPERLAVMGWGYGGFMAAHTIARSHRFGAAVLGAPVADLVHMRATSDRGGMLPDYLGGELWERLEAYRDGSPLLQADRITTPVLILHGEADRRVPPAQGLALHRVLELQGLDTRMVLYPGAPHRFDEPAQRLHAAREVLDWLDSHLAH